MKVIAGLIIFITIASFIITMNLAVRRSRFLPTEEEKLVLPKQDSSIEHLCKNKNDRMCKLFKGKDAICCEDKCVDLDNDSDNCGACNNKCSARGACYGGKCLDVVGIRIMSACLIALVFTACVLMVKFMEQEEHEHE